jgi:hypothetical protein
MSLKPQEDLGVPDETRRVARAAFPKGCACLRIGDVLGCVYQDKQFEALFPRRGQPAEAPGRLALATVLQFTEGLPRPSGVHQEEAAVGKRCVVGAVRHPHGWVVACEDDDVLKQQVVCPRVFHFVVAD